MPSKPPRQKPRPRRPSTPALVAIGLAVGLGLGAASLLRLAGDGGLRYTGVPRLELPLPPPREASGGFAVERAVLAVDAAEEPPATLDPALSEPGPYGPLPRVGAGGRTPLQAYARRAPRAAGERHRLALLVVDLGLRAEATEAALALPGAVSLAFSPYARNLPRWMARARRAGHEVLLGLPLEPAEYPDDDPGPHTLLAGADAETNLDRLAWLLARGAGYAAVAGGGERFAADAQAPGPVLAELSRRGLALVEFGDDRLAAAAAAAELPYASAPSPVDAAAAAVEIDFILAGLESRALTAGSAVGVVEAHPVILDRLRPWLGTLAGKGILLTPLTALLGDDANLQAERRGGAGSGVSPQG